MQAKHGGLALSNMHNKASDLNAYRFRPVYTRVLAQCARIIIEHGMKPTEVLQNGWPLQP